MHDPHEVHLKVAKMILLYIKGTLVDGLLYPIIGKHINLIAYLDAIKGGDLDTRRSY